MGKIEPQPVDDSVAYVQGVLTPEENARFEAVIERGGYKKGAFVSMAVMERVAKLETKAGAK